jgi:predicted O-methyltransferase YrrM
MTLASLRHLRLLFMGPSARFLFRLKLAGKLPFIASNARRTPGHLSHVEGLCLRAMARTVPAGGAVVEIGSYLGRSTNYIAGALKPGARLFCVDTWRNDAMPERPEDVYDRFLSNTMPYRDQITPLRGRSEEIAKGWKEPIRLLFIDGDHSYEACKKDILAWLPFVVPGGVVCFHDYTNPFGVRQAVDELFAPRCRATFAADSLFGGVLKRDD